jgi:16S rRNA (adenine1518-N6/adenine1519-N6)-dimethyltransferase
LTAALLAAGHPVWSIEVDSRLVALLEERFVDDLAAGRFAVACGDAREADYTEAAAFRSEGASARPWLAGNLPYSATTPIVLRVLEHSSALAGAVLMVQREYGERMLAEAGKRDYSSLSVRVAAQAETRPLLRVGRSAFWPRPGVESIVVELRFPQPPPYAGPIDRLERVLRAAFGQRRKTLQNALAHGLGLSRADAASLLRAAGCAPEARAETLPLARFAALADLLPSASDADGA